ncbi:MAG: glycosyltransferase [Acidobacteriia bacterium]|nr:glycosyltransferase [Terriglobia bacterium]
MAVEIKLNEWRTEREPLPVEKPKVAVVIPCFNEALTIGDVVRQFHAQMPDASIYVFDNNSSDGTSEEARKAGALVFHETRQGKGFVVQSMFRKVDADIYVIVDGDGTYPAEVVEEMVEPVRRGDADMVIGSRLHRTARSHFRLLNRFGNRLFKFFLNRIFGVSLTDLLSGYRVFSKRLVRGLPLFGGGFETEVEMTIKALERGFAIREVPVNLGRRVDGSHSKIRIVQDGFLIMRTMLTLFRDYRPLTFFGGWGLVFVALGMIPGGFVIQNYLQTGLVFRLPLAVLAVALVLIGVLLAVVGVILHTISRRFFELDYQVRTYMDELYDGKKKPGESYSSEVDRSRRKEA